MALKNAFDSLATESTLKRLLNMVTFTKDIYDRLRIVVDSGTVAVYNRNTSTNMTNDTGAGWQNSSSWNSVDAREPLKLQHAQRSDFAKRNRWTY